MKAATGAMATHLAGPLTTLASCWEIKRTDNVVLRLTDCNIDINIAMDLDIDGLYKSGASYTRSAMRSNADMSVDNLDMQGILDATEVTDDDIAAGRYDYASVKVFLVNWNDLSNTMGIVRLRRGFIGQTKRGIYTYTAELRGMMQLLQNNYGRLYGPLCDATFGDWRCTVDLGPLTSTGTVTAVTSQRRFDAAGDGGYGPSTTIYTSNLITFRAPSLIQDGASGLGVFSNGDVVEITGSEYNDGTYVFLHVTPGTVGIEGSSLNNEVLGNTVTFTKTVPGKYDQGVVTWLTGANAGLSMEVKTWIPPHFVLEMPMPYPIQIGDTYKVVAGCDKTIRSCIFYNNSVNFRGFTLVIGQDAVFSYPNAQ